MAASVLIVEDETLYLDALSRILDREGYDVLKAEEPRQALEIIRNTPAIDVVLSDVIMPGMRGTDFVRELAQMSPQTACVLMTGGMIDSSDLPQGTQVLRKPFSTRDLVAVVQEAIARSAELRARAEAACERAAELQSEARRLLSECDHLVRESAETRRSRRKRERRNKRSKS